MIPDMVHMLGCRPPQATLDKLLPARIKDDQVSKPPGLSTPVPSRSVPYSTDGCPRE